MCGNRDPAHTPGEPHSGIGEARGCRERRTAEWRGGRLKRSGDLPGSFTHRQNDQPAAAVLVGSRAGIVLE